MEIAAFYDIETEDWDKFVCGGYLDNRTGEYFEANWEMEDKFWARILQTRGTVIAHNGGRFDHLAFIDSMDRFGVLKDIAIDLTLSGASISTAKVRGNGIGLKLADSYKMFPMPLKKLSNNAKTEVGLACTGHGDCAQLVSYQRRYNQEPIGCGGYCRIRRDMSQSDLRTVMDYCRADVFALRDSVSYMVGLAEEIDIDLRFTIGGTTWNTAKRWAKLDKQPLPESEYHYARSGYYGGRVSLLRNHAETGFEYDITSSYPFQCSQVLPTGQFARSYSNKDTRRSYGLSRPGIYTAKVIVPEMYIPPLPIHAKKDGEKRLCYPTGTFTGTWALPELEYAESIGCKIEPLSSLTFESEEPVLAEYMQRLISKRLEFGKETREGEWLKLVANSLYGKLASRPETQTVYINPPNWLLMKDCPICGEGECSHWQRIGKRLPIYVKTMPKIPDCGYIAWAAYITARGRVQLHEQLTAEGGSDALYCDTDSVFTTRRRGANSKCQFGNSPSAVLQGLRYGDSLGEWSYKGAFTDFQGIAPKVYRYTKSNGQPKVKAKGLVMPGDQDAAWDSISRGERVSSSPRIRGFRTAVHNETIFSQCHISRQINPSFGDRTATVGGDSRPPAIEELELIHGIGG